MLQIVNTAIRRSVLPHGLATLTHITLVCALFSMNLGPAAALERGT